MAAVIIINGYPESGKDTFVDICKKLHPEKVHNFLTSTPAKDALHYIGWDGEKTPEARKLLSNMMEFSYKYNGPIKYLTHNIALLDDDDIVFIHCREWENIQKFSAIFDDSITLFIDRYNKREFSNLSDAQAGDHKKEYNVIIDNNSTLEDLEKSAKSLLNIILGRNENDFSL